MSDKINRLVNEAHFSELAAKIWVKSDGRCVYCGEDLVMTSLGYSCSEHDHILPASKYDFDNLPDEENNLVLSCKLCNHLKKNFDPLERNEKDDYKNIIKNEEKRTEIITRIQRHIAGQIGERHAEWWAARQILRGAEIKWAFLQTEEGKKNA